MPKDLDIIKMNHDAWDAIVDQFANYRKDIKITPTFATYCENTFFHEKSQLLDIGCGTGIPFTKYLTEQGFNVTGIDIAESMIRLAKTNVPEANFLTLSMMEFDYENMFDGIVSSYSMQLLDPFRFDVVTEKISKALLTGGLFYLSLNEPDKEAKGEIVNYMNQKMYFREYTQDEIINICLKYNLHLLTFSRQIERSDIFGVENMIEFIFKKH